MKWEILKREQGVLVLDIYHPLRMCISKVTRMWWSKVNFFLCEWVFDLVWEHTSRKTRYDFLDPFDVSSMEDIVVDEHIVTEESHLGGIR